MEKYKELYLLAKEVFNEEQNRFNRIDEKAAKYFSVLTLLVGAAGFFGKWLVNTLIPPDGTLEWALLLLGIGLLVTVLVSWFTVFSVFRIHEMRKIPLSSEMIDFFDKNKLLDIHYALARGLKEALEENRKTTDSKSRILSRGYNVMRIAIVLLALVSVLFGFHALEEYSYDREQSLRKEASIMMSETEKENPNAGEEEKPADEEKPNPNIQAPVFDIVTEGLDPSKIDKMVEKKYKK